MTNHNTRVYDSILDLLPNVDNPTPLVRISRVTPFQHTQVFAKLEWYNPFGSVKDRVAANMIADAAAKGLLADGQKLVEPTSGNTGMGLAMIANKHGYQLTTPLSLMIPLEKRTALRFFGCKVIELMDTLCPAPGAPEGAIALAMKTAEQPDFLMLNQYENAANPGAHTITTGPEIWEQTGGKITHFVAGLGTCGTITGTGRFLKSKSTTTQVLGVHPEEGHDIPGVRSIRQLQQTKLFHPDEYDGLQEVTNQEAFDLCLRINREEAIIAGPSSGMALAGAFRMVPDAPGTVVVVVFPDNVFKYASSLVKHLPQVRSTASVGSLNERLMKTMIENVRGGALTLDVDQALAVFERDKPAVIDVRGLSAYRQGHIPGAMNAPLDEIEQYASLFPEDRSTPMLCVCRRGNDSLAGVLYLKSLGYENARGINGGMTKWAESGYPAETG
jgi:cysteine synthase/rhodanese-related sulfurtransferase